MARVPTRKDAAYLKLLSKVRKTLIEGQQRLDAERVRIYWKTGRDIYKDILKNKDRGEYGKEVTARLAADLDIHVRVLQYCVQFAREYPRFPNKVNTGSLSKWSHYRHLLSVTDQNQRKHLEIMAKKNDWSPTELAARIKEESPSKESSQESKDNPATKQKLLNPLRGELYTYKVVKRPNVSAAIGFDIYLDLGFGALNDLSPKDLKRFSVDQIVVSQKRNGKYYLSASTRTEKDRYTYKAYIEKIIDADTIKVRIDLGFGQWQIDILRLRDLNTPEMDTKEGVAAKAFVQSYIKEAQELVIRSSKSDKYSRLLADIYIPQGEEPNEETDLYLNNMLLEKGHAQRW